MINLSTSTENINGVYDNDFLYHFYVIKKEDKLKMIESDNEEEVYNSIMEIINV